MEEDFSVFRPLTLGEHAQEQKDFLGRSREDILREIEEDDFSVFIPLDLAGCPGPKT